MGNNEDHLKNNSLLDMRLGAPMKKVDGLSCDKKKSESEHLHVFRDDIYIGEDEKVEEE